ncbi:MAG TPA: MerR family transcriptional regulator [Solirubrobacteraceae bacterium]|nr:MerR family transcriptional regulator [Solirubrobacteraceae bacterium]
MNATGLLKMSELAERSGVPAATIKHYLREGLLGGREEVVRTSRNMAYYPPEFVERIRLIKRLQEERFMPLKLIRGVLAEWDERPRTPRREVLERYDIPPNVLDRLAEVGALTPTRAGYDPDDLKIIEAIVRFRAGGYDEALGFTVYDTIRYREALAPLVREEVRILLERLAGEPEARAVDIIRSGREPLRELVGALHSKLLISELERQRGEPRHPGPE